MSTDKENALESIKLALNQYKQKIVSMNDRRVKAFYGIAGGFFSAFISERLYWGDDCSKNIDDKTARQLLNALVASVYLFSTDVCDDLLRLNNIKELPYLLFFKENNDMLAAHKLLFLVKVGDKRDFFYLLSQIINQELLLYADWDDISTVDSLQKLYEKCFYQIDNNLAMILRE